MKGRTTHIKDSINKLSHVSWGAIFAGAVISIAAIFLLNLLGAGVGLTSINPTTEADPLEGIGTGTIIWWVLSNLIALFVGGMVAGRLAGFADKTDGALHGVLSWSVYALLSLFLVMSAIGHTVSGVAGAAGDLFSSNKSQVVVKTEEAQKEGEESTQQALGNIRSEILQIVNTAARYNVLPEGASETTREVLNNNNITARGAIESLNIEEFFRDLEFNLDEEGNLDITVKGNEDYFDEEGLKDYLANNTQLTEAEINGLIDKWSNKIEEAIQEAEELYREARQEAIEFADKMTDAIGNFAIAAFFALLLGAGAAMLGGGMGADQLVVYSEEIEVEENVTDSRRSPRV